MKNLLVGLSLFVSMACTNVTPAPEDLQNVSYMPTQCSEPWDAENYTKSGDNRGTRLVAYLKDKGITNVYNLKSTNDGNMYCQACTCPSGELFSFGVSKDDYTKLKSIEPFSATLK